MLYKLATGKLFIFFCVFIELIDIASVTPYDIQTDIFEHITSRKYCILNVRYKRINKKVQ